MPLSCADSAHTDNASRYVARCERSAPLIKELAAVEEGLRRAKDGETVVIVVESQTGRADPVVAMFDDSLGLHARLDCAQACRTTIGAVADDLNLDEFSEGAIVLEDAQWADPTSLGRLERLIATHGTNLLLVVGHRPLGEIDRWWVDKLIEAAQSVLLVETTLASDDTQTMPPLEGHAADVVAAAALLTGPLSVEDAASLTALDSEDTISLCEGLVRDGYLAESRSGYSATAWSESAVGEARLGHVAGRLAAIFERRHEPPALVGSLRLAAGDDEAAFDLLFDAAVDARGRHASGEAFHLAEAALTASQAIVGPPSEKVGQLHVMCGSFLRAAGRTQWASDHAEEAMRSLEGEGRVEALSLAARLADDAQRPSDADHLIAWAEWEAASNGSELLLGSLYTFRARTLSRLGFALEADWVLDKSFTLIGEEPSPEKRVAQVNRAWIHFDRGEASQAETAFAQIAEAAARDADSTAAADSLAWRSRALFAAGEPDRALEAISEADRLSSEAGVEGPVFLTQLARTEAGITYGLFDDALEASERVLDLVLRQLPAWENMARTLRAQALLGHGSFTEAAEEIERAIELSPPGADGWRWRIRARGVKVDIDQRWRDIIDGPAADDLADVMLQSRFYGWAAELMCVIAEAGHRPEAAAQALAIATQIGQPMLAARAAEAGGLWGERESVVAIARIHSLENQIPPGWRSAWAALPHVTGGLDTPVTSPTEDEMAEATRSMESALAAAGLVGDEILSPAQRRHRGLVPRGRIRRTAQFVAAAVAVIAVAAATAFGVTLMSDDPPEELAASPVTTRAPSSVTTVAPGIADLSCEITNGRGFLFGTSFHRGGPERSGYNDVGGPRSVQCMYWQSETAGAITTSPVAFGQQLFVGTETGTFYIFDQTTGSFRTIPASGVDAAPAWGQASIEGAEDNASDPAIILFVDDAGVAQAHSAGIAAFTSWSTPLGTGVRVTSSPIIDQGRAFLAGSDGVIRVLNVVDGTQIATWPADGSSVGEFVADLAMSDELLYAASQDGHVYVLDTGPIEPIEVCRYDARAPLSVSPVIDAGVVHVPTDDQRIWMFPAGDCDGRLAGRLSPLTTETPNIVSPAIVDGVMYIAEGPYLYAKNLDTNTDVWLPGIVDANSTITTPPVVTNEAVYFGAEDGTVYAVDKDSGDVLWQFATGLTVRGAIAVVEDAVFLASENGFVYALGDTPAAAGAED